MYLGINNKLNTTKQKQISVSPIISLSDQYLGNPQSLPKINTTKFKLITL